jgi:hypothetical protein
MLKRSQFTDVDRQLRDYFSSLMAPGRMPPRFRQSRIQSAPVARVKDQISQYYQALMSENIQLVYDRLVILSAMPPTNDCGKGDTAL